MATPHIPATDIVMNAYMYMYHILHTHIYIHTYIHMCKLRARFCADSAAVHMRTHKVARTHTLSLTRTHSLIQKNTHRWCQWMGKWRVWWNGQC